MSRLLTRFARPTGFSPSALPGLILWLTAGPSWCYSDDAGTIPCAVGDAVAVWKDRSGAANHLSQTAAGNRPTLQQDASGKYYLQFNTTAHLHRTGLTLDDQMNVVGFAVRRNSGQIIFAGHNAGPGNTTLSIFGNAYRLKCGGSTVSGGTDASGADRTIIGVCNAASSVVYGGGVAVASGDAGSGGIDELHVGASATGGTGFDGRIYGGLVADAATIPSLHSYLQSLMP